ncbi:hypothetical protein HHK36_010232 [Tetracentron sinense]|uniref:NAD-dependent epimerase/dehydratase domain-containing protein n=1 Tax=Tetracentron sinense TaxID=13715 RepID=A0A835DIY5_TETSI|nr:hypothetical protein HHK36_010232 [Tetracentron sinense]
MRRLIKIHKNPNHICSQRASTLSAMELCRSTLAWTNFVSPSLHISQPLSVTTCESKRFRVCCLSNNNGSDHSLKSQGCNDNGYVQVFERVAEELMLKQLDVSWSENQMIVSITGATGFIGRRLVQRLHSDNHCVRVLTRSKSKAQLVFPVKNFPGVVIAEEPEWKDCIQGSNAVVNLAGLPISTRWSYEIKREIKQSRIGVTSKVVDLINESQDDVRPTVLVSATAIGYYGSSEAQIFDERSPSGNDYLAEVCREWEATALKVNKDVRVALIRIGVVLGKDGGALAKMIPLFMMFAGGPLGTGKQWFSWIHLDDIVNLICESLSNPSYKEAED